MLRARMRLPQLNKSVRPEGICPAFVGLERRARTY